jgi:hypothetical protein
MSLSDSVCTSERGVASEWTEYVHHFSLCVAGITLGWGWVSCSQAELSHDHT